MFDPGFHLEFLDNLVASAAQTFERNGVCAAAYMAL
jgi:hypothetical protein